jgi:hypothetical protein
VSDTREPVVTNSLAGHVLRGCMCASGLVLFIALGWFEAWTWIPLAVLTWMLGHAADLVEERGVAVDRVVLGMLSPRRFLVLLIGSARRLGRVVAAALTFHYVCLAWIFFRAQPDPQRGQTAFDNALEVLGRLAAGEHDYPNVGWVVRTALAVGFLCHFFADGSFRWLRDRFVSLPPWAQGCLLAAVALVLRELAQTKMVPFIYFQF